MTTGKAIALTRQTFVGKVISLLFNMLSRLVCCTIALISHDSKVVLKSLQARLQQYVNCEIPDIQAGFRKVEDQIRSDQISHSVVSDSLRPHESQHTRPPCPSPTPGVHWDSCPSSQWCHCNGKWNCFLNFSFFFLTFVQIIDKITEFLKLWEANSLSFNSFKLWKTDVKQNKKMTWKNSLYLDIL